MPNQFQQAKAIIEASPASYIQQLFSGSDYKQNGSRFYFDAPAYDSWDYNCDTNICTDFRNGEVFDLIGVYAKLYCNDNQGEALKQIQSKIGLSDVVAVASNQSTAVADIAKHTEVEESYISNLGCYNNSKNQAVFPYYISQDKFNDRQPEYTKVRTSLTDKPKYIFQGKDKNQKQIPYLAWKFQEWIDAGKTDLYIVEGETDAIVMNYQGCCCIGISGAQVLSQSLENKAISDAITAFSAIYFVIENDSGGSAFLNQAKKLPDAIKQKSKAILLPDEKDITDIHKRFRGIRGSFFTNEILKLTSLSQPVEDVTITDPEPITFGNFKNIEIPECILPEIPYFKMVSEVAKSTQSSYELAVGISLVLASTLFQKLYKVEIKESWHSNLNLWALVLLVSGGGKSPVLNPLIKPFQEWEADEQKRIAALNKPIIQKNDIINKKIERIKKDKIKKPNPDELLNEVLELELQIEPTYIEPRLFARNATPEALLNTLSKQKGKLTLVSDEGIGVLENITGRYDKGAANDSDINSCWDGADLYIDRISRDTPVIRNPIASVCLLIQDDKFKNFKNKQALADSGHLNRYLMISTEQNQGNRRFNNQSVAQYISRPYSDFIKQKLSQKPELDDNGEIIPKILNFSNGAKVYYEEIWNDFEVSTAKGNTNADSSISPYLQKAKDNVARIAGILHCLQHDNPEQTKIDIETLKTAKTLTDIFVDNFKQIYELMELDENQENATIILDWLETHSKAEFTVQELWQAKKKGRFKNMEIITNALNVLVERQYIFETNKKPLAYRINNHLCRKTTPRAPKTF